MEQYPPLVLEFEFKNERFKSAQKGLEFFAKDLGERYDKLGPVLKARMEWFLKGIAQALYKAHSTPWPGGTSPKGKEPGTLSMRSGRAVRSILQSVKVRGESPGDIQGRIGGVFYLRTHEFGATIRAKKANYLTIPLKAALNPDGTPKRKKAKDWSNTFVAKSKKGNLIIFRKVDGGIEPLYLLKKEVKIPARLGMGFRLRQQLPYFVDKATQDMYKLLLHNKRESALATA